MGYQFNVLFGDKDITDKYGVTGIPTLVVIDKNGVIRYKHIGYDPLADQLLAWEAESLL
jgi:thioredoxin-related protein